MLKFIVSVAGVLALGGCVTTRATADQVAFCEQMSSEMGVAPAHDHAEAKGAGRSTMNLTHDQCRKILAQSR